MNATGISRQPEACRTATHAPPCHARMLPPTPPCLPPHVGQASACHAPHVGQASACHAPSRPAFTLVELLVVIGIIGLLAAIITPVVMQSLTKARNAAIKAEIDMLHMAIMNYKNEYGSFPPCYDVLTLSGTGPVGKHIKRIFPRCTNAATELTSAFTGKSPTYVTPGNAIAFWLSGFTDDPTLPLTGGTRKKLFDFDASRLNTTTGFFWPSGKDGSPYVYFVSGTAANGYGVIAAPNAWSVPVSGTHSPQIQITASGTTFFNSDTFQILCAGRDEQFGNDDDLSNFWPGTRREYRDSQKD